MRLSLGVAIGPRRRTEEQQQQAQAAVPMLTDEQGTILTAPDGTQITEG